MQCHLNNLQRQCLKDDVVERLQWKSNLSPANLENGISGWSSFSSSKNQATQKNGPRCDDRRRKSSLSLRLGPVDINSKVDKRPR